MKTVEFREALREAMSEEMRRDKDIFIMGEEVAEYNGAYKVTKGMLAEFGPQRVIGHTHCRARLYRNCRGSCHEWVKTYCGIYDF